MDALQKESKTIILLPDWSREHKLQYYKHQIRLILPVEWLRGRNYSRVQIRVGQQETGELLFLLELKNGDSQTKITEAGK